MHAFLTDISVALSSIPFWCLRLGTKKGRHRLTQQPATKH